MSWNRASGPRTSQQDEGSTPVQAPIDMVDKLLAPPRRNELDSVIGDDQVGGFEGVITDIAEHELRHRLRRDAAGGRCRVPPRAAWQARSRSRSIARQVDGARPSAGAAARWRRPGRSTPRWQRRSDRSAAQPGRGRPRVIGNRACRMGRELARHIAAEAPSCRPRGDLVADGHRPRCGLPGGLLRSGTHPALPQTAAKGMGWRSRYLPSSTP